MTEMDINEYKTALRRRFRSQRRQIPPAQRQAYAEQVADLLSQQPEFRAAKRIAVYRSLAEELSTDPLLSLIAREQKIATVPVVNEKHLLQFVTIDTHTAWKTNRYGILEPDHYTDEMLIAPESFDIVLMPLVSFDGTGARLGMGGGYYDRTFAFRRQQATPLLIGLAFEIQQYVKLPVTDEDITLDGVITEKRCYRFGAAKK